MQQMIKKVAYELNQKNNIPNLMMLESNATIEVDQRTLVEEGQEKNQQKQRIGLPYTPQQKDKKIGQGTWLFRTKNICKYGK